MDIVTVRSHIINSMCRLCLSTDDNLFSIFDESHSYLPQRIAACVNVEVYISDIMPTTICRTCITKVEDWFNFKKCCDDSQSKLRQWDSINSIICNKTMNLGFEVKEEILSESEDQVQTVDEISIVKVEDMDVEETPIKTDSEQIETEHLSRQSLEEQNSSQMESSDSLLVPTYECPAIAHGLDAPSQSEYGGSTQKKIFLTRNCRQCNKEFSSVQNRLRHERTVHGNRVHSPTDSESNLEPEIINVHSLNSDNSNSSNNNAEVANNVSTDPLAASFQLEKSTGIIHKPKTETHFIEYNKMISNMITNLKCVACKISFSDTKYLYTHLDKVMILEKFSCYFCCISFPNRSQFMKHVSKDYCQQREQLMQDKSCTFKAYEHYQCTICSDISVHKTFLTNHLLSSHLLPNHPNSCERCQTSFQDANEYREHLQGPCFYKIYCSICKTLYSTTEFNDHCNIHKDNDVEFNFKDYIQCENIDADTVTNETENSVNTYSCGRCGEQFATLDLWCEHQQIHSNNDIHRCTECNRVFGTELELDQHKNTHVNIKLKLYRCSDTNSYKTVPDECSSSSNSPQLQQNADYNYESNPVQPEEQKRYKCTLCKKTYSSETYLRQHKKSHSNIDYTYRTRKRKFVCPKCSKIFRSMVTCAEHKKNCVGNHENLKKPVIIKQEHGEYSQISPYICTVCNKICLSDRGLALHSRQHLPRADEADKMQCQVCNKQFINIEVLLDHLKTHSSKSLKTIFPNIKPHATKLKPTKKSVNCKVCKKKFLSNSGLSSHMRTRHGTNPIIKQEPITTSFKCKFCGIELQNRLTLNLHLKTHVEAKRAFNYANKTKPVTIKQEFPNYHCDVCKKDYVSEIRFRKHLETHVDEVEIKFKCNSCNANLPSDFALKRHIKGNCLHCVECNKIFTTVRALTTHRGWHAREGTTEFNCTHCTEKFDVQRDYIKHLKTHQIFKCTLCTKKFQYLKSLSIHIAYAHSDESGKKKKVKNPMNFKNGVKIKQEMVREIKTEINDERPKSMYRCTECNTTFVNSKMLRAHVLSMHMANSSNC